MLVVDGTPMTEEYIILFPGQCELADAVTMEKWDGGKMYDYKHREGKPIQNEADALQRNIDGTRAEYAYAIYRKWYEWVPRPLPPGTPSKTSTDVYGHEVRCTDRIKGRLIIQPDEPAAKPRVPFVLAIVFKPHIFRIVGWCYGEQGPILCPVPWILKKLKGNESRFAKTYNVDQHKLTKFTHILPPDTRGLII